MYPPTLKRANIGRQAATQHVAAINMMRANGSIQGSAMRNMSGISTPASETMRNQRIDVIRDIMSREEEGSLRMSILQQMLEDSMRSPTNEILSDPSVQASANNRQWWA